MNKDKDWLNEDSFNIALQKAREDFSRRDLGDIKKALDGEELTIDFLGSKFNVTYPLGIVEELGKNGPANVVVEILILRYLALSDGTAPSGSWMPFRDISGGTAYVRAFKERAEDQILQCYERDSQAFKERADAMGGTEGDVGEVSYRFKPFPLLPLQVVIWEGDDELPGEARVLFDKKALRHLEGEELATLGEVIADGFM